ncbi:uncharacterized protein A1O9_02869 [Exophiala aquamarina CBS 119918]|uniref:Uncharacterized protein n=1 Tax=Exophiala aquamarina CBS 119918 TaxID=1182545 RepID=A0A072PMM5_9EURO|nr:uncharacterized protein A1O9_02869 [Exophiala aquamarina CBS 119918]KEF61304.1 hypothetical protein A1O9_02869 [Exophiala aquamarina CBS 119918]
MAEENRSAPQADFNALSLAFRPAADEIKKLPNLPAIASGESILSELRQMRNETREQFARLEQRITTRLEQRITASHQGLLTVLSTIDLNSAARVQNTYLSSPSDRLSPFLNPLTGAIIPTFPTTPAEIGRMAEHDVDAILQQLGLQAAPAATSLAMKKRRLRVHIGLRSQVETSA